MSLPLLAILARLLKSTLLSFDWLNPPATGQSKKIEDGDQGSSCTPFTCQRMKTFRCHLFRVFVSVSLILSGCPQGASAFERTVCRGMPRDDGGDETGAWMMLKPSGDNRFMYLSLEDARKGKPYSLPLTDGIYIDDIRYSPILRTVYGSKPLKTDVPEDDNRLHLAWNDQQPRGTNKTSKKTKDTKAKTKAKDKKAKTKAKGTKKTPAKGQALNHEQRLAFLDPNLAEIISKGGLNAWGRTDDAKHAHSKGYVGISVIKLTKTKGLVVMYLMTHSFPRMGNAPLEKNGKHPNKRSLPPEDPKDFLGPNTLGPTSKAQHAMCISMEQEVTIKDGIIQFDRSKLDLHNMNLFALLNGLDIIGPSITLTNYVPWLPHFKIYHQLFDIRASWSNKPFDLDTEIETTNLARSRVSNKSDRPNYSKHAFPLWPSNWYVDLSKDGKASSSRYYTTPGSLRDSSQIYATRCRVWEAKPDGRKDPGCHASATLTSTGKHPLIINLWAKSGRVIADVDDIISSRLLPKRDWDLAFKEVGPEEKVVKKYVTFLTIWQTWITHSTLSPHLQVISDTPRLKAAVYHYNSYGHTMPTASGEPVPQPSNGYNHSKWCLSYLFGQKGRIKVVVGISDLNRDATATALSSGDAGRGGFFFITDDPDFARFFLALEPIVEDNSTFTNLPMSIFTKDYKDEAVVPVSVVKRISKTGDGMEIILPKVMNGPGKLVPERFALPFCEVPEPILNTLLTEPPEQCRVEDAPTSPTKIRVGKDDFISGSPSKRQLLGTPKRFRSQVRPRRTSAKDQEYSGSEEKLERDSTSQKVTKGEGKVRVSEHKKHFKSTVVAKKLFLDFQNQKEPEGEDQMGQDSGVNPDKSVQIADPLDSLDSSDVTVKFKNVVTIPDGVYAGWSRPMGDDTRDPLVSIQPNVGDQVGSKALSKDRPRPDLSLLTMSYGKPVGVKGTTSTSGSRLVIDLTQSPPKKKSHKVPSKDNDTPGSFLTVCDMEKSRGKSLFSSSSSATKDSSSSSESKSDAPSKPPVKGSKLKSSPIGDHRKKETMAERKKTDGKKIQQISGKIKGKEPSKGEPSKNKKSTKMKDKVKKKKSKEKKTAPVKVQTVQKTKPKRDPIPKSKDVPKKNSKILLR